jgi:hypothetical protein
VSDSLILTNKTKRTSKIMTATDKMTIIKRERNEMTHELKTRFKEKRAKNPGYERLFYTNKDNVMCKEYDDPEFGFEIEYDDEYGNEGDMSDNSLTPRNRPKENPFNKQLTQPSTKNHLQ